MEVPLAPPAARSPEHQVPDGERWAKRWALVAGIALLVGGLLPSWTLPPRSEPLDLLGSFDMERRWVWPWEYLPGASWTALLRWSVGPVAGIVTLLLARGVLSWHAGRTLLAVAVAHVGARVAGRFFDWHRLLGDWRTAWYEAGAMASLAVGTAVCLRARHVLNRFVVLLGLLAGLVSVSWPLAFDKLSFLAIDRSPGWAAAYVLLSTATCALLGVAGLLVCRRPRTPDRLASFGMRVVIAYAVLIPLYDAALARALSAPWDVESLPSLPGWLLLTAKGVLLEAGAFALPVVALAAFLEALFTRRAARATRFELQRVFE